MKDLEDHNKHLKERGDIIPMPLKNIDASALSLKPSFHDQVLQWTTI